MYSHEDIAKDPDRSHGRRNINAHEPGKADRLSKLLDLHDVVLWVEVVILTSEDEGDDGQPRNGAAIDDVLAANDWRSTEHLKLRFFKFYSHSWSYHLLFFLWSIL